MIIFYHEIIHTLSNEIILNNLLAQYFMGSDSLKRVFQEIPTTEMPFNTKQCNVNQADKQYISS